MLDLPDHRANVVYADEMAEDDERVYFERGVDILLYHDHYHGFSPLIGDLFERSRQDRRYIILLGAMYVLEAGSVLVLPTKEMRDFFEYYADSSGMKGRILLCTLE